MKMGTITQPPDPSPRSMWSYYINAPVVSCVVSIPGTPHMNAAGTSPPPRRTEWPANGDPGGRLSARHRRGTRRLRMTSGRRHNPRAHNHREHHPAMLRSRTSRRPHIEQAGRAAPAPCVVRSSLGADAPGPGSGAWAVRCQQTPRCGCDPGSQSTACVRQQADRPLHGALRQWCHSVGVTRDRPHEVDGRRIRSDAVRRSRANPHRLASSNRRRLGIASRRWRAPSGYCHEVAHRESDRAGRDR